MPRLKDRESQIPHGLTFYEPALKWRPQPYSSFDTIVKGLIQARRANAYLTKQNRWSTDYETVATEVDRYNAKICEAHGWAKFVQDDPPAITGGPPLPPSMPRSSIRSAENAVAGAKILTEWFGDGAKPVPVEQAQVRAHRCATCPQNKRDADWTSWFTVPAAVGIRKMLELRDKMKLSTPEDEMLNVCDACGCPLKLKVHTPLVHIVKNMPPYQKELLDPDCWVLHET